ncbi:MAG: glycosyltransferase [Betaproteobacteria bacterium]|nr:glycosyltransferase [Betaproteobacteria bacterium]
MPPRIAVLIPCHNEAAAIRAVVEGFRAALPGAAIHVFDNNSSDRTAEIARAAGAQVRPVPLQGKGHVVRRMFADVEADAYVLVDGDHTYPAASAPEMVQRLFGQGLDMVTGRRIACAGAAYRPGHRLGNRLLTGLAARLFGNACSDMLSGYRVFSRRFVKSFPALSTGFEIETELTVHALKLHMPVGELDVAYAARPEGSASKLNTWLDGLRILGTLLKLLRQERPLAFFGVLGAALGLASVGLALPLFLTYAETGLVPRLPTAVLVTGLMLAAGIALACGLILDTVTRGRDEVKRLAYLGIAAPAAGEAEP